MDEADPKRWLALTGISILSFVVFIDFTIVNTILPGIERKLHASVDDLQRVMNGFILMLLPISALVVIVPPLIGGMADRIGPMRFIIAGQVFLALSALVQIFCEPASSIRFVLFGLGLLSVGWGLQQATSALTATSALAASAAGLAIGRLYMIWNFGSSVGLAIGGLIFEEIDKNSFMLAISEQDIKLNEKGQEVVRSVLSDPSQAQKILDQLSPDVAEKMLPIFRYSVMDGYSGTMWYLLITCILGAFLVPLIAGGTSKPGN